MSAITVAGGLYRERCLMPEWDEVYGSAGRAAAALSGHVDDITVRSYAPDETAAKVEPYATMYGFVVRPTPIEQTISFEYIHSLSVPVIRPAALPRARAPLNVSDEVVLRFGMLEGSAVVNADRCVYDPQSAFDPEPFAANRSTARHLAIVGNQREICALGDNIDAVAAARSLLQSGAEVVIIKGGPSGARVVEAVGETHVEAYQTENVWKIGSGDVFSAMFAAQWGVHRAAPVEAARLASRAAAVYVNTMALPVPSADDLRQLQLPPATIAAGRVYLAGPFFDVGQRWLVEEARRCLLDLGLPVFSPVHDVGLGEAMAVVPADLEALRGCDRVFAILDGLDSGTLFEVGYARALEKPVYALARAVPEGGLKMVTGSGCRVFADFVTAVHHATWRS